jgi:hypothetical protein
MRSSNLYFLSSWLCAIDYIGVRYFSDYVEFLTVYERLGEWTMVQTYSKFIGFRFTSLSKQSKISSIVINSVTLGSSHFLFLNWFFSLDSSFDFILAFRFRLLDNFTLH